MKHTLTDGFDLGPKDIINMAKAISENGGISIDEDSGLGKAIIRAAENIQANENLRALNKTNAKRLRLLTK